MLYNRTSKIQGNVNGAFHPELIRTNKGREFDILFLKVYILSVRSFYEKLSEDVFFINQIRDSVQYICKVFLLTEMEYQILAINDTSRDKLSTQSRFYLLVFHFVFHFFLTLKASRKSKIVLVNTRYSVWHLKVAYYSFSEA